MSTRTDRNHLRAASELARLQADRARFVCHDGIRIELLDTLSRLGARVGAIRLLDNLASWESAGDVEVYPLAPDLIARGIELFRRRPDKEWGLTDCLSFVLMQDFGIYEAFTSDHHFEQAGFLRLIGP